MRIDFGGEGKEFWHTWWSRGKEELNSPEFKVELQELVNELRETSPLKSLSAMSSYCAEHGGQIEGGWRQNYGYVVETEHYRYCLQCNPGPGDYQAYLTAFDLRVQRMNMKQGAKSINRKENTSPELKFTEHYRYCLRCNPVPGDYEPQVSTARNYTTNKIT